MNCTYSVLNKILCWASRASRHIYGHILERHKSARFWMQLFGKAFHLPPLLYNHTSLFHVLARKQSLVLQLSTQWRWFSKGIWKKSINTSKTATTGYWRKGYPYLVESNLQRLIEFGLDRRKDQIFATLQHNGARISQWTIRHNGSGRTSYALLQQVLFVVSTFVTNSLCPAATCSCQ